jgi:cytosylglucuronate decarboxylase
MRPKYLFIRILEACNADCFMCGFAQSRDPRRFTAAELARLMPSVKGAGVGFVRFTGGEPLMNQELPELVRLCAQAGLRTSVITNGMLLPKQIDSLAASGLAQVIVSLDGASARTHDLYRATPGCFDNAVQGLREARSAGVRLRINTVAGPHNYTEIPEMQRLFTRLGIGQWELSALKLERPIVYDDPEDVRRVCDPGYTPADLTLLVPLGKRFYGDTEQERELFFSQGITPRASRPLCHVTDDVIFYDPINQRAYACSCLAYRSAGVAILADRNRHPAGVFTSQDFAAHAAQFKAEGPRTCTGCSTTAAGYSDDVAALGHVQEWAY